MIYLDTSVALAHFLGEDRVPAPDLWRETLVSSRLLEYEFWNRIHARGLTKTHADGARALFARVSFMELSPTVLVRALEPFPVAVRTLDALHLATVDYLRSRNQMAVLATYDERLAACAQAMGLPLAAV
ncbi:MAG: PIN domain-containing protein [Sulfuricaulis sp.]|nr:PIN domain-containing protein [Sulfuricaulis sp.]